MCQEAHNRFGKVLNVIHDDMRSGDDIQFDNAVGEISLTIDGSVKCLARTWRDIRDELHQGTSFVHQGADASNRRNSP